MPSTEIRFADPDDLTALTDIYNEYVLNSAITFDTIPFSAAGRQSWLAQFRPDHAHQCLVAVEAGRVLGYASSSQLRPKPAYDSSVETTIYLHPDAKGRGLGRTLYSRLLENLAKLGVHRCYGIIALPNQASVRLHQELGFKQIGLLNEVGFKFGRYHDTAWFEKRL